MESLQNLIYLRKICKLRLCFVSELLLSRSASFANMDQ